MLRPERYFWAFLLCFCQLTSLAQDPYSITFTSENGLPSNTVYDIIEDKKGFIWIASDAGLTRYDGFEFRTFTCDEQTSRPGSNLFEDPLGRIWYQNFDGFLYYIENDRMKFMPHQHPIGYLRAGLIRDHLFLIQKNKISVRNIRTFREIKQIPVREYVAATQNENDYFYYIDLGIFRLDYDGKKTEIKAPFLPRTKFPGLMKKGEKEMWFMARGTDGDKCYFSTPNRLKPKFSFQPHAHLQNISATWGAHFWLCTTQGVVSINERTLKTSNVYFPKHNISCTFRDRSGNYWFATQNTGIIFVPDFNRKLLFQDLRPRKVVIDGNTLYLSTINDKIYKVDLLNMEARLLFDGKTNHMINQLVHDPKHHRLYFTSSDLNCIGEDGEPLLNIRNFAAKDYAVIDHRYIALAVSGFCGLYQVPSSNKSPSEWDALFQKNVLDNGFMKAWSQLMSVRGKSVTYDPQRKTIYYAVNIGLFKVGLRGKKQLKQHNQPVYTTKLKFYNDNVYALSTSGKILIITPEDRIHSISDKLGLNNIIIQHLEIKDNKLILASQHHIYVFDFKNNLRKIAMVPSYNLDITMLSLWKNRIVFVSEKGLLLVPMNRTGKPDKVVPFCINQISINERTTTYDNSPLYLSHKENNLELHYSILDYGQSHDTKLQYRINNGFWANANTNSRSLKLASLSPGDYIISFQLENNPQVYNVRFTIAKPWYATWWFIFGIGLLILGSLFVYFRRRIKRLQHHNALLSEKFELEEHLTRSMLTSIKSQMNPHFFYNALNTIQYFIFTNDRQNASMYLSKFSKLTRMILEMSDKEHVLLQEEINALRLYLDIEKVRFDGDFEFSIEVDSSTDIDLIRIPSMIIQPYVENAIKHGLLHKKGEKKLALSIRRNEGDLEIIIDDNGIGREMANELNNRKNEHHRPFATSANQKRLELLNKGRNAAVGVTYIDKSKDGRPEGTTVVITIPINN